MIERATLRKAGCFTKPHGIKGEIGLSLSVDIFSHTDDPFIVCEMEGILVPFFIEGYRSKTAGAILVKLEAVDSGDAVRVFSHRPVYCPAEYAADHPPRDTEDKEGYAAYTGYTVSDKAHGPLGTITDIDESTANVLLKIDGGGKELLIPAVQGWITSVRHEERLLEVSLPDGLLDL
ncbi:MAG: 16S rRNA processing protein RimM [Tannerellaceae bacterium]|jgi:16S rRNA processing protein RimM|nr:16S rRNA processing protein RimM [Tannerellaceae bacterium]